MDKDKENIKIKEKDTNFFRRRKKLIFILLSSFFIMLFFIANKWRFDLDVEKVEVEGNILISAEAIIKESGIKISSGLYDYDLKDIEKRIEKNSYVKKAIVQRELPSIISIKVIERKPLAIYSSGDLFYIDEEKKIMKYNLHHELLDLPVITGIKIDTNMKSEILDTLIFTLKTLREKYINLYNQISEINILNQKEMIFYSNNFCVPIIVGSDNILHKIENLDAFWKTYSIFENLNNINSIDLRFNDQVVVRWNNKL